MSWEKLIIQDAEIEKGQKDRSHKDKEEKWTRNQAGKKRPNWQIHDRFLIIQNHKLVSLAPQAFVDRIRESVDKYPSLFVFSVDNMRNLHFKELRDSWKDHSSFFMGKNRIMSLALGRDEAEEYADKVGQFFGALNLQQISNPVCLCFSCTEFRDC